MKKTKRILSLLLALVMIFSSLSLIASAKVDANGLINVDPAKNIVQGYVTNTGNANERNATILLDWLDGLLKEENIFHEKIVLIKKSIITKEVAIEIDLTSINGILKTIDLVDALPDVAFALIGDLSKLNLKNWKSGLTKENTSSDVILKNIITLLSDNKAIVTKVVDGSFTCGSIVDAVVENVAGVNPGHLVESLIGADLNTFLKQTLAYLAYPYADKVVNGKSTTIEDGSGNKVVQDATLKAKYDACVKKTLDDIIFVDLLTFGVDRLLSMADDALDEKLVGNEVYDFLKSKGFKFTGALSGFTYDKTASLDAIVGKMADVIYNNNLVEYVDLLLENFGERLNGYFERNEYLAPFACLIDFTNAVDTEFHSTSIKDLNPFIGQIVSGLVEGFAWNNSVNLGKNIENLFKWAIDSIDKTGTVYADYNFGSTFTSYALALSQIIVKANESKINDPEVLNTLKSCTSARDVMTKLLPYLMNKGDVTVVSSKSNTYDKVLGDILGYYINQYVPLFTDANNTKRYQVSSATSVWDVLNYALNYYLVDLNLDTILGLSLTKSQTAFQKLEAMQAKMFGSLQYTKASQYIKTDLIENLLDLNLEKLVKDGFEKVLLEENKGMVASKFVFSILDNLSRAIFGGQVFPGTTFTSFEDFCSNASLGKTAGNLVTGLNKRKADILPVVYYFFTTLSDLCNYTVTIGNNGSVKVTFYDKTLTNGTDYTVTYSVKTKGSKANVTVKGKGDYAGVVTGVTNCVSHSYDAGKITKAATVKAAGVKTFTCKICGGTKTQSVAKLVIAQVKGLKISKTAGGSVTLSWSKAANAVSYGVEKSTDGKKWTSVGTTSALTINAKNLTAGVKYKFRVRGINSGVYGAYSAVVTSAAIKPATVTGLKGVPASTKSVKLTWTAVAGAKKYEVQQSTDGKKWTTVATPTSASATVSKLVNGKTYKFRVLAVNGSLKGAYSAVVSVSMSKPAKVAGLKNAAPATTSIKLTWNNIATATKYEVYKSTDGKKWTKVATPTTNTYTVTKLSTGKTYQFKVRAYKGTYVGDYSAVLKTGTLTAAPTKVTVTSSKSKTAVVSFGKVAGASKYIVQYTTDKNFKSGVKSVNVTTNKATVQKLTGGSKLYFKVIAVNAFGAKSAPSAISKQITIKK